MKNRETDRRKVMKENKKAIIFIRDLFSPGIKEIHAAPRSGKKTIMLKIGI